MKRFVLVFILILSFIVLILSFIKSRQDLLKFQKMYDSNLTILKGQTIVVDCYVCEEICFLDQPIEIYVIQDVEKIEEAKSSSSSFVDDLNIFKDLFEFLITLEKGVDYPYTTKRSIDSHCFTLCDNQLYN
jgi:hypothetical protein